MTVIITRMIIVFERVFSLCAHQWRWHIQKPYATLNDTILCSFLRIAISCEMIHIKRVGNNKNNICLTYVLELPITRTVVISR